MRALGGIVVNAMIRSGWMVLACAICQIEVAAAQTTNPGCAPENSTNIAQTLRCLGGVTIVAENGARYILLAFLAPILVKAAVAGRLPRGIGVERLRDAPTEWRRQFEALGLNPE
jgi:hypothetical protein